MYVLWKVAWQSLPLIFSKVVKKGKQFVVWYRLETIQNAPYIKYLTIDMLVDIAQNDMLPPVSCTAITVAIIKRNTKRNALFFDL